MTAGMPILRASVDHGTAMDIAGTRIASDVSMVEAIPPCGKNIPHLREIEIKNYKYGFLENAGRRDCVRHCVRWY